MKSKIKNNSSNKQLKENVMHMVFLMLVVFAIMLSLPPTLAVNDNTQTDQPYLDITMLNQDPDPAEPGEYVELRFKVVKSGNKEMSDLKFRLEPEYPFYFDSSDNAVKEAGDWRGFSYDDEFYTLYYKLRVDDDALEDTYDLKLGYKDSLTNDYFWIEEAFQVRVDESNNPVITKGNVVTSPIKLYPDSDENQLMISINNVGEGDAESVNVELELPDGFEPSYSYSDETNLGSVDASESADAEFYIDIEDGVLPGQHKSALIITYKEDDDNELITKEIPFSIDVKHKPSFELLSHSFNHPKLLPGDTIEMKLNVENIGNKEAESVSIRAFKDSSHPFDFNEKSDFMGTMDSSEKGEAILKFDIEKDAEPKKYLLDVEIRSIYNNVVFIQEETVPLVVSSNPEGSNIILYSIFGLIAVLLLAAAYLLGVNNGSVKKQKK